MVQYPSPRAGGILGAVTRAPCANGALRVSETIAKPREIPMHRYIALAALCLATPALANTFDEVKVSAGKQLFDSECRRCHARRHGYLWQPGSLCRL